MRRTSPRSTAASARSVSTLSSPKDGRCSSAARGRRRAGGEFSSRHDGALGPGLRDARVAIRAWSIAAISGFGADGPLGGLPGYDAVLQAMCGLMSINGSPESGPMRMGVPVVDHLTGYTAMTGILMALYVRSTHRQGPARRSHAVRRGVEPARSSRGELVLFGSRARGCSAMRIRTSVRTTSSTRATVRCSSASSTTDSFANCASTLAARICASDPRFATNAQRVQNLAALRGELEKTFATLPVERCAGT